MSNTASLPIRHADALDTYFSSAAAFESELLSHPALSTLLSIPELTRLRNVSFITRFCSPASPPTFSRYDHSLGVAYLASRSLHTNYDCRIDERERLGLITAALLHDIGHPPFSHVVEPFLFESHRQRHLHFTFRHIRRLSSTHDHLTELLSEALRVLSLDSPLSHILAGLTSCDNLDGIARSAVFFGVSFRDPRSLLVRLHGEPEQANSAIRSVCSVTQDIYETKLLSPEVLAVEATLCHALELLVANGTNPVGSRALSLLSDDDLLGLLRKSSPELVERLEERTYLPSLEDVAPDLDIEVKRRWSGKYRNGSERRVIAHWIARRMSVDSSKVIVYCKRQRHIAPPDKQLLGKRRLTRNTHVSKHLRAHHSIFVFVDNTRSKRRARCVGVA
jgi:HD superfamily phosphohydrolase